LAKRPKGSEREGGKPQAGPKNGERLASLSQRERMLKGHGIREKKTVPPAWKTSNKTKKRRTKPKKGERRSGRGLPKREGGFTCGGKKRRPSGDQE